VLRDWKGRWKNTTEVEGLEGSLEHLDEELERVTKQETWVSERWKKDGSDLALK